MKPENYTIGLVVNKDRCGSFKEAIMEIGCAVNALGGGEGIVVPATVDAVVLATNMISHNAQDAVKKWSEKTGRPYFMVVGSSKTKEVVENWLTSPDCPKPIRTRRKRKNLSKTKGPPVDEEALKFAEQQKQIHTKDRFAGLSDTEITLLKNKVETKIANSKSGYSLPMWHSLPIEVLRLLRKRESVWASSKLPPPVGIPSEEYPTQKRKVLAYMELTEGKYTILEYSAWLGINVGVCTTYATKWRRNNGFKDRTPQMPKGYLFGINAPDRVEKIKKPEFVPQLDIENLDIENAEKASMPDTENTTAHSSAISLDPRVLKDVESDIHRILVWMSANGIESLDIKATGEIQYDVVEIQAPEIKWMEKV